MSRHVLCTLFLFYVQWKKIIMRVSRWQNVLFSLHQLQQKLQVTVLCEKKNQIQESSKQTQKKSIKALMVPQRYHIQVARDEIPSLLSFFPVCMCHLCESKPFFSSALSSKKIVLCHTFGWVSELGEKTIYFLYYCSQRMSLLPQSWTLEDHLGAWNIPAWLP